MNLNTIYNWFYGGQNGDADSLWAGKKEQKIHFFLGRELILPEFRNLNTKLWNDKTRRSRFLSDAGTEPGYIQELHKYLLRNVVLVFRLEEKCRAVLEREQDRETFRCRMNQIMETQEQTMAPDVFRYLTGTKRCYEYWRAFAFLILYALLDTKVSDIYRKFLLQVEAGRTDTGKHGQDLSVFISEYPADGLQFEPGALIEHSWVLKNQGTVIWKNRYCSCEKPDETEIRENLDMKLPEIVFPGEMVTLHLAFLAPEKPGIYELMWKMRDENGIYMFPESIGLGLHFSVEKNGRQQKEALPPFYVLSENLPFQQQYGAGEQITHSWLIENNSDLTWSGCFFRCINAKVIKYSEDELRIPIKKKLKKGERVMLTLTFYAPYEAGVYHFVWKITDHQGNDLFPDSPGISWQLVVHD